MSETFGIGSIHCLQLLLQPASFCGIERRGQRFAKIDTSHVAEPMIGLIDHWLKVYLPGRQSIITTNGCIRLASDERPIGELTMILQGRCPAGLVLLLGLWPTMLVHADEAEDKVIAALKKLDARILQDSRRQAIP